MFIGTIDYVFIMLSLILTLQNLLASLFWLQNMSNHSVVKLHEATPVFVMVDYVRQMTVKEFCKYDE